MRRIRALMKSESGEVLQELVLILGLLALAGALLALVVLIQRVGAGFKLSIPGVSLE